MGYVYAVLGGGRQGTAAAYDMAKFGDADAVLIADISWENAVKSCDRVNALLNKKIAQPFKLDVTDKKSLQNFLNEVDSFLSAVPYWYNLKITETAIEAKANMCDLGGNTELVKEQLKLDEKAKEAGIAVIPDCGQVPGMGTSLVVYAMSFLDKPEKVYMWDGGIPQNPVPPFNYILTFNIAGLTNEYYGTAKFLKDYKVVEVPTFREEDYELVSFPEPIGELEAFVTSGGTSTAPWTFEGKIKTFINKTLRHKGHFVQWKTLMDFGFLEEEPIEIRGVKISPREVLHALAEPKLKAKEKDKDIVIVRVKVLGEKDGKKAEALVEVIDYYDEETGFTAMSRTTGWDGSIVAIMNAKGITKRGVNPVEIGVPADVFVEELKKRGINVSKKVSYLT